MNLPKRNTIKKPESPIEWKLLDWFKQYGVYEVVPQYELPPYRIDFAIPEIKLAIE